MTQRYGRTKPRKYSYEHLRGPNKTCLAARCWCYSRKCPSICWINALGEQNIGGVIGQGLIIILTLFILLLIELSNRPSIFLNTSLSLGLFAVPPATDVTIYELPSSEY